MSGRQGYNIIGQGRGRTAGRAGVNPNPNPNRAAPAAPSPSGGLSNVLGNIEKHFNRTLFDSNTINETAVGTDGYYVIRISPIDNGIRHVNDYQTGVGANYSGMTSIVGILEKFPNFSINATWSEQGGLTNIAPSIGVLKRLEGLGTMGNAAMNRMGVASRGQKFASKKVYSKSGYLDFEVTFKCINWDGTQQNSPMNVALTLFSYTLPMAKFNMWDFIKSGNWDEWIDSTKKLVDEAVKSDIPDMKKKVLSEINMGKQLVGKLGRALPGGTGILDALKGFSSALGDETQKMTNTIIGEGKAAVQVVDESGVLGLAGDMGKNMFEFIDDYGIFRAAPAQVSVTIGKFFENYDMVIENVSVKLSEEMTEGGPLWAEFTVKFSSRTIMSDPSELGLKVWDGKEFKQIPKPKDIEQSTPPALDKPITIATPASAPVKVESQAKDSVATASPKDKKTPTAKPTTKILTAEEKATATKNQADASNRLAQTNARLGITTAPANTTSVSLPSLKSDSPQIIPPKGGWNNMTTPIKQYIPNKFPPA